MASRVHALFTRPARPAQPLPEAPARKPLVRSRGAAEPVVAAVGAATRDRCACGHSYGSGPEVWQELRGGHLRCFCGGCAS